MDRARERADATDVVVVVMEAGSRWPASAEELHRHASHRVVLSQDAGECPITFATRVARRMNQLAAANHRLCGAVLAVNGSRVRDVAQSRSLVGRMLARSLVRGGGSFVLTGDDRVTHGLRGELAEVAEHGGASFECVAEAVGEAGPASGTRRVSGGNPVAPAFERSRAP